jgi:7-carboxy-7-deazaguanine synthase
MTTLKINEIFYSIQGEGLWMGRPNTFIRTSGCNLRCSYCDTPQAYYQGKERSIDEILSEILKFSCTNICITGGEPLLQENIHELLIQLSNHSYNICLETNGSKSIKPYLKIKKLLFSLDIKCPSSKMHKHNNFSNLKIIRPIDQIKFIIGGKEDYDYAKQILHDHHPMCTVFFQPIWGFSLKKISSWILNDQLPVSIGIQLHKFIWGEQTTN